MSYSFINVFTSFYLVVATGWDTNFDPIIIGQNKVFFILSYTYVYNCFIFVAIIKQ